MAEDGKVEARKVEVAADSDLARCRDAANCQGRVDFSKNRTRSTWSADEQVPGVKISPNSIRSRCDPVSIGL